MNTQRGKSSVKKELINEYNKAKEKRDFVAMREIYTELWKRNAYYPYPDIDRDEIVFFTEVLGDNSIVIPHELLEFRDKMCLIGLFDGWLNVSVSKKYSDVLEEQMKEICVEFKKTVLKDKLELSPLALKSLQVKSGDILRIEFNSDETVEELNIHNENDGLKTILKE